MYKYIRYIKKRISFEKYLNNSYTFGTFARLLACQYIGTQATLARMTHDLADSFEI